MAMKGKGAHGGLSLALAVLKCSRSLALAAAHLPSEANVAADTLSRQSELPRPAWPFRVDQDVVQDIPLRPGAIWKWIQ